MQRGEPLMNQTSLKRRLAALERFTVDLIYGRRDGSEAPLFAGTLRLLSYLFEVIVRARGKLYQARVLRNHHLGCLVIVVGNLTVGGTGKTPVVEKLARSLAERGRTVGILSRGYKSKREPLPKKWMRWLLHRDPPPPKVVSDGQSILLDSESAGDEPYMLARNLPGVVVLVDKDRVKAGLYAIRHFGVDTLILDDGFQYFRLKDHLQLLLVDKTNPFGNRRLLPRGILREPVDQLKRASYIFLTKSDGSPQPELLRLIRRYRPNTDLIECAHSAKYLQPLPDGEQLPLAHLHGKRVAAFCAIAVPESFYAFLTQAGAELAATRYFLDHHRFSARELHTIANEARQAGAEMLLTTEKDAVRLPADFDPGLPLLFLRMEIEIIGGVKDFDEAVSRICFPRRRARLLTSGNGPERAFP